jgi:hypothetical protein
MHRLRLSYITSYALAPHIAASGIEIAYFIYTWLGLESPHCCFSTVKRRYGRVHTTDLRLEAHNGGE